MKKNLIILLLLCLSLLMCACGKEEAIEETPAATVESVDDLLVDVPEKEEETEELSPADEALAFVDRPLSELIAKYGEPEGRVYSQSCLGDGEDGELKYKYFTVYTYKEGDQETVLDVR